MRKISIILVVISIINFVASIIVLLLYGDDEMKNILPYLLYFVFSLFAMIYCIVFTKWINEKDNEVLILKQRSDRINDRVNEKEKIIDILREEIKKLKEKINK